MIKALKKAIVNRLPISWVFNLTYKKGWWGRKDRLYSGAGTDDPKVAGYSAKLIGFIRENKVRSIVEIGCGDFSIMQEVLASNESVRYTGFDVSSLVVNTNKTAFGRENIEFIHADAAAVKLPSADLLIVRQVLQHIDNARIARVVNQFSKFRFCLITEHQALGSRENPNVDKKPGPDTRLSYRSGVHLDLPPFGVAGMVLWYSFRSDETIAGALIEAEINTFLISNDRPA